MIEEEPFFSVLLTTHNAEKTISRTIMSVLDQTFREFEIIVVDDFSDDQTVDILTSILDSSDIRSHVYTNNKNMGVSYSRNCGIQKADGKFVAFLDDDDIWLPEKLHGQHRILKNGEFLWIFSNYLIMNDSYEILGKRVRKSGIYNFESISKNGNPVGMLTTVVSRKTLLQYPFQHVHHEDYDLWLTLSRNGIVGYLDESETAAYMKHSDSISGNKFKSICWTYDLFRKHGISKLKSWNLLRGYVVNTLVRRNKV